MATGASVGADGRVTIDRYDRTREYRIWAEIFRAAMTKVGKGELADFMDTIRPVIPEALGDGATAEQRA
jgi:hypothetical protein